VAYRQLGFYRLLDKDWNGAIALLERGVQINAQDVQAWVWLGRVSELGQSQQGDRELQAGAGDRTEAARRGEGSPDPSKGGTGPPGGAQ